ncbi:MAG: AAA family ATPase, partial [Bdellovibrionota bacterium]
MSVKLYLQCMPHERIRQCGDLYRKVVSFSAITGVFGHRQVGKSTYVASVCRHYFTFDDEQTLLSARRDPRAFLHAKKTFPIAIDECQLEPRLFPAIKELVRTRKQPGQFILSGSVRFTSRKAIRESLAGRIVSIELLPLVLSELASRPLPEALPSLLRMKSFSETAVSSVFCGDKSKDHELEKYLLRGGLPGLCFVREERLRSEALNALHQLILDRDLRLIVETRLSIEMLMRFLREIANG